MDVIHWLDKTIAASVVEGGDRWRARLLSAASLVFGIGSVLFVPICLAEGLTTNAIAIGLGALGYLASSALVWRGQLKPAGVAFTLVAIINVVVGVTILGRLSAIALMWLLMICTIATVSQGMRAGSIWLGISGLLLVALDAAGLVAVGQSEFEDPRVIIVSFVAISAVLQLLLDVYSGLWQRRTDEHIAMTNALRENNARIEQLLGQLESEKETLCHLLENLPVGVCWTDGSGGVLQENARYASYGGHSDHKEVTRESVSNAPVEHIDSEETWTDATGDERFLMVKRVSIEHAMLGAGTLVVAMDISQQHQLEEQLRRSRHLEAIGRLAAGVAHEINTPIQYVSDNTRFLLDVFNDVLPLIQEAEPVIMQHASPDLTGRLNDADLGFVADEVPTAIEQTLQGLDRVREIVRGLKTFSHPSQEMAEADLNGAIETTITVSQNEWKYYADIERHLDPALGTVVCQVGAMNQVLLNLIVNAAHAIETRLGTKKKGTITIASVSHEDEVEICVSDNGCGIPEDIRQKIFEPFFTTKPVGKGTGQGLCLVHNTVEQHQGRVMLESEVGAGTTFRLFLPREEKAAA